MEIDKLIEKVVSLNLPYVLITRYGDIIDGSLNEIPLDIFNILAYMFEENGDTLKTIKLEKENSTIAMVRIHEDKVFIIKGQYNQIEELLKEYSLI